MTDPRWQTVREALLPPYSSGGKVWEGVGPTPQMQALIALDSLREEMERGPEAVAGERTLHDTLEEWVNRAQKAEAERDELITIVGHAASWKAVNDRVAELEAKVERLTARGIEDMQSRIAELEAALREIVDWPTHIFTGDTTAYVPNYIHDLALHALGEKK